MCCPFSLCRNSGENGYIETQTLGETNNQFGVRLDHYLSVADTLNFRYMYSSGPITNPLSPVGANVPGFPVGDYDRAQNFVAQDTHVFSPRTIGVARFSFLRNTFLLDEHLRDRVEGISVPRRVVQHSESHESPLAGQRHQFAKLQANSAGCGAARDSGGVEVSVLDRRKRPACNWA